MSMQPCKSFFMFRRHALRAAAPASGAPRAGALTATRYNPAGA